MQGNIDDVRKRGALKCGVSTGVVGFSAPDANGVWHGFDVGMCRAVAAAVLGDPMAVEFIPQTSKTRFSALASGEIDMLSRTTTWTYSRDSDLNVEFAGVNFYDGQGFLVSKELGVKSAGELNGATICIKTGTTSELNLADCVFPCPDGPLPYLDEYPKYVDSPEFPEIRNEELLQNKPV